MLNQLLKLYRKHRAKTPLEDFTTEVLVGLLNLEDEIKNKFIHEFLKLPKSDYLLKTQMQYSLKDDKDCIVDFVIESENMICFMENKVNSKEGYRQLERYGKVLATYAENGYETKLFYCTKYFDKKKYELHSFHQIRWFQIAKFLKQFQENTLAVEFINFLTIKDMAQELTFDAKDFVTIENLQNILKTIGNYLDRVKPIFKSTFKTNAKISDGTGVTQIENHNRLIYYFKDILGQKGYSELKYGFQLQKPAIYVGIWVEKSNEQFDSFIKTIENRGDDFVITKRKNGISIEIKREISVFLNDEESDSKIADWYKKSFNEFANLIKSTPELDWKINVA